MGSVLDLAKFILFLFFAVFVPGYVALRRVKLEDTALKLFLSTALGMVLLTLAGFVSLYLVYGLLAISLFFFFRELKSSELNFKKIPRLTFPRLLILFIVLLGVIFQNGSSAVTLGASGAGGNTLNAALIS